MLVVAEQAAALNLSQHGADGWCGTSGLIMHRPLAAQSLGSGEIGVY
jgi:hypothetical protein